MTERENQISYLWTRFCPHPNPEVQIRYEYQCMACLEAFVIAREADQERETERLGAALNRLLIITKRDHPDTEWEKGYEACRRIAVHGVAELLDSVNGFERAKNG